MNINEAEVLRRIAKPHLGRKIGFGPNPIDIIHYRVIRIQLKLFHSDSRHPNPIILDNIENDNQMGLPISSIIEDMVKGHFNISLNIMLEPWDGGTSEYQYQELERFLLDVGI